MCASVVQKRGIKVVRIRGVIVIFYHPVVQNSPTPLDRGWAVGGWTTVFFLMSYCGGEKSSSIRINYEAIRDCR